MTSSPPRKELRGIPRLAGRAPLRRNASRSNLPADRWYRHRKHRPRRARRSPRLRGREPSRQGLPTGVGVLRDPRGGRGPSAGGAGCRGTCADRAVRGRLRLAGGAPRAASLRVLRVRGGLPVRTRAAAGRQLPRRRRPGGLQPPRTHRCRLEQHPGGSPSPPTEQPRRRRLHRVRGAVDEQLHRCQRNRGRDRQQPEHPARERSDRGRDPHRTRSRPGRRGRRGAHHGPAHAAGDLRQSPDGMGRPPVGNPILDFWDDLLDDGQLEDRQTTAPRPIASLAGP